MERLEEVFGLIGEDWHRSVISCFFVLGKGASSEPAIAATPGHTYRFAPGFHWFGEMNQRGRFVNRQGGKWFSGIGRVCPSRITLRCYAELLQSGGEFHNKTQMKERQWETTNGQSKKDRKNLSK
jgi:hypothetical protein